MGSWGHELNGVSPHFLHSSFLAADKWTMGSVLGQSSLFALLLPCGGQEVGDVAPTAHSKPGRDPLERDARLAAQSLSHPNFLRVAFASPRQFRLGPAPGVQFLGHDSPAFLLRRFPALTAVVVCSLPLVRLRQQFLTEGFVAQAPAAAHQTPIPAGLLRTALLHALLELAAAGRAVPGNVHLA